MHLGEEMYYFNLQDTVLHQGESGQELKARTWKQELKKAPWSNAAYWLSQVVFLYNVYNLGLFAQGQHRLQWTWSSP